MVDKNSAPAFSIGSSIKRNQLNKNLPGPGSYNVSSIKSPLLSKSKINGEIRFKTYQNIVPGPGSYNNSYKDHVPIAKILSKQKQIKKQYVPGPGTYQPNYNKLYKSQSGYKLSSTEKTSILGQSRGPGPAQYNINRDMQEFKKAIAFPHEKRSNLANTNKIPGPGQYNIQNNKFMIHQDPVQIFNKSNRSSTMHNLIPGPGSYEQKNNLFDSSNIKNKGFSLGLKKNQKDITFVPGPGTYQFEQMDKIKLRMPTYSLSKQPKLKLQNEKQIKLKPGPQQYKINIDSLKKIAFKMNKSAKMDNSDKNNVPGPGTYQINHHQEVLQFSIPKSSSSFIKSSTNPGPANYEPKLQKNTQNQYITINKDNRRAFYNQKKEIPGPGTYNEIQSNKKKGFTIGHEERSKLKESRIPGPGDYMIPSTISNLPNYTSHK